MWKTAALSKHMKKPVFVVDPHVIALLVREGSRHLQACTAVMPNSPVCVKMFHSNRPEKVHIGHANTAVIVCFLLAWWMDQKQGGI